MVFNSKAWLRPCQRIRGELPGLGHVLAGEGRQHRGDPLRHRDAEPRSGLNVFEAEQAQLGPQLGAGGCAELGSGFCWAACPEY